MSKKFAALMFFVMVSLSFAQAQSTTTASATSANPSGVIIKGGVNFSNISTQKDGSYDNANTLTTFNVGILGDFPIVNVLSLQPGVVLTGKGTRADYSTVGYSSHRTFNPLYIEVPVNLVVKLPLGGDSRIFFGAGPYGAFGVGGKVKETASALGNQVNSEETIKFGDDNNANLKSFDFGLNGLAGIEVSRLVLGVNYGLGLSKVFPNQNDNNADNKNKYRVFSVNVGVRF